MKKGYFLVVFAVLVFSVIALGCAKKKETALTESEMPTLPQDIAERIQTITIVPGEEANAPGMAPVLSEDQQKTLRNKQIQEALKIAGHYKGEVDGKIGPVTRKAVREFQAEKGLVVDGKVGPKTWAELEKILEAQLTQTNVPLPKKN